MPFILLVAGPNGAGKTTFARELAAARPEAVFVNAVEAALELPQELAPGPLRAGRCRPPRSLPGYARSGAWRRPPGFGVEQRPEAVGRHAPRPEVAGGVILETTLAGRSYRNAISGWSARGYEVALYYLRLPTVDASLERIRRSKLSNRYHALTNHFIMTARRGSNARSASYP